MSASRKVSVWLLVILLPVAALVGWHGYQQFKEESGEGEPAASTPKWKFVTEEHWLVDETARDITEMLAFAASGKTDGVELATTPQKGARESFDLRAKVHGAEIKTTLQWKDYIWSPAEYTPWAQQLVTTLKLTPTATPPDENGLLQTLTSPTPEVLHREAVRISDALTKTPLNAGLHEQAALVTAAFALREAAGTYCDMRRELCRVAAHLAIAQVLQPQSSSPTRKVAEAGLNTLAEREAPALAMLAELEHDSTPGVAAWSRALRLRNTADWRQVDAAPTLLEELEIFLARVRSVDPEFAFQWLEKLKPAPVHDWRRIMLEGDFSVERGHQFAKESIGQEIGSLAADWSSFFGGKLPENGVSKALNEPPARSIGKRADGHDGIHVLAWDMWSAQHQRHLCAAIHATIVFLRDDWGVPEYRDAQKFIRQNFADLTLLPTIERELTEDRADIPAISKRVSALLADHPEAVSPVVWGYLRESEEKSAALAIPDAQSWLKPPVPFGTTYDICGRSGCIHLAGANDKAWWDATLRLAPFTYDVLHTKLWAQYGNSPPAEIAESTYAPIREYNLWALRRIANAQEGTSPKYLETLKQICELDADRYFDLGDYYLAQQQPELAVEAYQRGVDVCPDRVKVANCCHWLVNYLDDHGQPEKALAIATEAAEVYSYRGLATMGRLQEKHGHLKEAQDYFMKIAERYNKTEALDAFYVRNQDKNPEYKETALRLIKDTFPGGLQKVTLADFQQPPVDGTALTSNSRSATAAGLSLGDVIVAIDGYGVHNEKQYLYVRALSDDPKLPLIVWNAKGYREIAPSVPERRFNVNLKDYHKK